jgi:hypothetical protein
MSLENVTCTRRKRLLQLVVVKIGFPVTQIVDYICFVTQAKVRVSYYYIVILIQTLN